MNQAKDLCLEQEDRRRRSEFFYQLATYAQMFPRMRRYLPLCGAQGDLLCIVTEERPEGVIVRVSGEVDMANVDRLREAVQPIVTNCQNLMLDWSALRYIDTTGLHVIINAQKALHQQNCQLIVIGASPSLARVMRVLHLDTLMPMVSSVDEAVELIREKPGSSAAED